MVFNGIMSRMKDIKFSKKDIGSRVYCDLYGYGNIVDFLDYEEFSVIVRFESSEEYKYGTHKGFTSDGNWNETNEHRLEFVQC